MSPSFLVIILCYTWRLFNITLGIISIKPYWSMSFYTFRDNFQLFGKHLVAQKEIKNEDNLKELKMSLILENINQYQNNWRQYHHILRYHNFKFECINFLNNPPAWSYYILYHFILFWSLITFHQLRSTVCSICNWFPIV